MSSIDTMNHTQRARFGRSLFRRISLPRTVATRLLLSRIAGGSR